MGIGNVSIAIVTAIALGGRTCRVGHHQRCGEGRCEEDPASEAGEDGKRSRLCGQARGATHGRSVMSSMRTRT